MKKKILFLDKDSSVKEGKYDGALVLDPTVDFHRYVTTLDFESLYPSIMMEGNITPDAVIMYPFKEHEMVRDKTSAATRELPRRTSSSCKVPRRNALG